MELVAEYNYMIEAYLADFRGQATLPMLGGFMLQAASRHAEERNFGFSYMTNRKRAWVLTRMNIEIFEYPKNDTRISLQTWVSGLNKLFTERCFSMLDCNGKEIGCARSLWAAIDIETRRPTNVLDLDDLAKFVCEKESPISTPSKITSIKDGAQLVDTFEVKYSDIDINKHLNSMKYIEHFCNAFPISFYQEKNIHSFEINYMHEGLYGTTLDVVKYDENKNIHILEMRNGDKTICSAKVTWK